MHERTFRRRGARLAVGSILFCAACGGEKGASSSEAGGGGAAGALASGGAPTSSAPASGVATSASGGSGGAFGGAGGGGAGGAGGNAPPASITDFWAHEAHFVLDQPTVPLGGSGHREAFAVPRPDLGSSVVYLYHRCFGAGVAQVCLAVSEDGGATFPQSHGVVVAPDPGHPFAVAATVAKVGGEWAMVFEEGGSAEGVAYATSPDGVAWTKKGPLFPGSVYRATPGLYVHEGTVYVFYGQFDPPGSERLSIIFSSGESLGSLVQYGGGYVLRGTASWEKGSVSMPRVVFDGGAHWMFYEGATLNFLCGAGSSNQNVYGWGVARSTDLTSWTRYDRNPVVQSQDEETCGHDMPQPVRMPDGSVFVYYTSDDASTVRRAKLSPGQGCGEDQSFPGYREKNLECMKSCGGLGGTECHGTKHCPEGKAEVGESWDCASCCQ